MPDDHRQLPARPELGPDEALDGYLERAASLNDVTSPQLLHALLGPNRGDGGARTTFLMLKPDPALIEVISRWTGARTTALRRATLCRFDGGLPLDLHLLDPHHPMSLRQAAPSQWLPGYGTQLCTACLATDATWKVQWRLPLSTICPYHSRYLAATCCGCHKSFRMQRSSPLRRLPWPDLICDNPTGDHSRCTQPLDEQGHPPEPTEPEQETARRIRGACDGEAQVVLGRREPARTYLQDLRSLSILLLHLAAKPHCPELAAWTTSAARDAQSRGGHPRWAIAPPVDAHLRAAVLATADGVLHSDDAHAAAGQLATWLSALPASQEGARAWVEDHTRLTDIVARTVEEALAPRGRVAHLLHKSGVAAPDSGVFGTLSIEDYRVNFAALLDLPESTGHAYISLCLAREEADVHSWAEAAERLNMPREQGVRLARNASAHLLTSPRELGSVYGRRRPIPAAASFTGLTNASA